MFKEKTLRKWLTAVMISLAFIIGAGFSSIAAATPRIVPGEDTAPELPSADLPTLPNYSDSSGSSLVRGSLPTSYDSRKSGYITSVKNQDPWGSCWAFSALSAGETSLIKKGLAKSNVDLSEMHLAYFMYHAVTDPLGLTKGDKIGSTTDQAIDYLDKGGNNIYAMFLLSKWTGAAAESTIPYSGKKQSYYSESLAYKDVAHLQNTRFINSYDTENVKKLITQYGSVSTSIFYHPEFQNKDGSYYFPQTLGVYNKLNSNHAVTVVGWDDSYPKSKLTINWTPEGSKETYTYTPPANGAWIVKNSYGKEEGDNGYIYISYYDYSFSSAGLKYGDFMSYAFDMESADNYDYNYQYDGSFGTNYDSVDNGSSIAARYTIQGLSGKNEQLDAVSFSFLTQNVNYSIQIYKNPTTTNPTSGTAMLSTPQTGKTTYSGYYTIPLSKKLVFKKGDSFSIVVTVKALNDTDVYFFIDQTTANKDAGILFTSKASNGQTFFKDDNGWQDYHKCVANTNLRLKAFTTKTSAAATNVDVVTSSLKKPAFAFSSKTYNKVKLSWKTVKNARGYQIYRSTSKNGNYKKVATTSKLNYTDKNLSAGTTYYYKIRAYMKKSGKTSYSYYSATKSYTPKLKQTKITCISNSGKKVSLKWQKVTGASGYEIARATSKNGKYKVIKTITKGSRISYTDKVPKKRTYYYKVRGYRKVSGKKVYGKYSSPQKIKTS